MKLYNKAFLLYEYTTLKKKTYLIYEKVFLAMLNKVTEAWK